MRVIQEAGGAEALAPSIGVLRKQIEAGGGREQEDCVAGGQYDFGVEPTHVCTPGAGSVISVKRMSPGSSSVTWVTVWRTPSQVM